MTRDAAGLEHGIEIAQRVALVGRHRQYIRPARIDAQLTALTAIDVDHQRAARQSRRSCLPAPLLGHAGQSRLRHSLVSGAESATIGRCELAPIGWQNFFRDCVQRLELDDPRCRRKRAERQHGSPLAACRPRPPCPLRRGASTAALIRHRVLEHAGIDQSTTPPGRSFLRPWRASRADASRVPPRRNL